MSTAVINLLEGWLGSIVEELTPESARRVLEFRIDAATNERLDILAAKANEGRLASEEEAEYEAYIDAMDRVALLRVKARKLLNARRES